MAPGLDDLSPRQRQLVEGWLPGLEVERDHSWGLTATTVLQVALAGERYVVKAGGSGDHHIRRELRAHQLWLGPWTSTGRAPSLVIGDADERVLVTRYLPGELVLDTVHEDDPSTYGQAGELLRLFHDQSAVVDDAYEREANEKALRLLNGRHRIAPSAVQRLREEVAGWGTPAVTLVPTHGDWQPRNWLIHEGVVSVIDFGRADLRPAMTDLTRLAAQVWTNNQALEDAFFEGYGADPRDPEAWRRNAVREAIGTAVWAFAVGDEAFEAQGHRMIRAAIAAR